MGANQTFLPAELVPFRIEYQFKIIGEGSFTGMAVVFLVLEQLDSPHHLENTRYKISILYYFNNP